MKKIPSDIATVIIDSNDGETLDELLQAANEQLPKGWSLGLRKGKPRLVAPDGMVWGATAIAAVFEKDARTKEDGQ